MPHLSELCVQGEQAHGQAQRSPDRTTRRQPHAEHAEHAEHAQYALPPLDTNRSSQSPATAAAATGQDSPHGAPQQATVTQQGAASQLQQSPDSMSWPSHASTHATEDPNERPDPIVDESASIDHPTLPGTAPQAEGSCQAPAPRAAAASGASRSRVSGRSEPFALEPGLDDEDEGAGLEQEGTGIHEEEEEEMHGDVVMASGDPGLGDESQLGAGVAPEDAGEGVGEPELPEEGWMWSVAQTPA